MKLTVLMFLILKKASVCYYSIENESGQQFWYSSNRFKTISENRVDKLNELGI